MVSSIYPRKAISLTKSLPSKIISPDSSIFPGAARIILPSMVVPTSFTSFIRTAVMRSTGNIPGQKIAQERLMSEVGILKTKLVTEQHNEEDKQSQAAQSDKEGLAMVEVLTQLRKQVSSLQVDLGNIVRDLMALDQDSRSDDSSSKWCYSTPRVFCLTAASITLSDSDDDDIDRSQGEDEENNIENNDENSDTRKRKYQSPVWEFAKKVGGKAVCNSCQESFVCPNGNTSNITNHIIKKHKKSEEANKLKEALDERSKVKKAKKDLEVKRAKENGKQTSIESFFPGFTQLPKKVKAEIDNNLVEFLICENNSFETVESHFFRKLMFSANNSYILPSRTTITKKIDLKICNVRKELAKEINDDIVCHKTISITSDGGNSGDLMKTKKNTLTVSRVTEDFILKTDVVAVPEAKGSQEAVVIRRQWKEELLKIGYDASWTVNVTTDGASNFRSARAPGRHEDVGLPTKFTSDCVDHQIHLAVEESTKLLIRMSEALKKGKALVTHFSRASLSRQLLRSIQEELGTTKLCPIVGTSNRWFHKMTSIERLVEIRGSVELFQARSTAETNDEEDDSIESINDEDWKLMKDYVKAVKRFETLSKFLGGQTYPAATSVIPALDQIVEDLEKLKNEIVEDTEGKKLIKNLLQSMQKRFPNCWKNKNPFNCLTYLDGRYNDLYADTDALKKKVHQDISDDSVYDLVRTNVEAVTGNTITSPLADEVMDEIHITAFTSSGGVEPTASTSARVDAIASTPARVVATASTSTRVDARASTSTQFEARAGSPTVPSRRSALLARKQDQLRPVAPTPSVSFQSKINGELERYITTCLLSFKLY